MNFKDLPDSILVAFARSGSQLLDLLDTSAFADELAEMLEDCAVELSIREPHSNDDDTEPFRPASMWELN